MYYKSLQRGGRVCGLLGLKNKMTRILYDPDAYIQCNPVIIIPSLKSEVKTLSSISSCPVEYSLVISHSEGVATARNEGARKFPNGSLLIMFDDDLTLKPSIWAFLLKLRRYEFSMCNVSDYISTRVFACWAETFWSLGGFDESIHYIWEDGDFYRRAIQTGFKFRLVPSSLYYHEDHKAVREVTRARAFKTVWEYSKLFAHYNRWVEPKMWNFFVKPFKKKHFRDVIFKLVSVLYWLTIRRLT